MNREFFESLLRPLTDEQRADVMLAYRLAKYGHRNQTRANGERYFEHPRAVAALLAMDYRVVDRDLLITALLHDIYEDSYILRPGDIGRIFGQQIETAVIQLTKAKGTSAADYFARLSSPLAVVVKIADRFHNLADMPVEWPISRRRKNVREAIDYLSHPLIEEWGESPYVFAAEQMAEDLSVLASEILAMLILEDRDARE